MLPPIGQNWNCLWSFPLIKSDLMEHFPRTTSGYRNCNWIVTAVITGASTISFWYLWHNYKTELWVWDAEEMRFWERRIRNQCQPPKQDTGKEKKGKLPWGCEGSARKDDITSRPGASPTARTCVAGTTWEQRSLPEAQASFLELRSTCPVPCLFSIKTQNHLCCLASEDSWVSELALIAVPCWSLQ